MAVYGAYVSSTLGMMSQSHSLNTISSNLANINTGGYKANETRFSTVLSVAPMSGVWRRSVRSAYSASSICSAPS